MTDEKQPWHVRTTLALESSPALEQAADKLQPLAQALVANPTVRRLLQDRIMGHALHPVLTDVPIGAWVSALVLDAAGGPESRPAARRLVGFGVLSAVPTVIAGWAEWAETEGGSRRVGVVHASANAVSASLFGASWLARRAGHHRTGVALSTTAALALGAGGFLGAHISLARKYATRDPAYAEPEPSVGNEPGTDEPVGIA